MLSFMMGSSRRMLALEKKALMVLRRMRCVSWSMVATMEFWAVLREKGVSCGELSLLASRNPHPYFQSVSL
jgi:hypothetical protein